MTIINKPDLTEGMLLYAIFVPLLCLIIGIWGGVSQDDTKGNILGNQICQKEFNTSLDSFKNTGNNNYLFCKNTEGTIIKPKVYYSNTIVCIYDKDRNDGNIKCLEVEE